MLNENEDPSQDDILDEIRENIRRDRKRLEEVCDELQQRGSVDPESMSMLSDSLTRSNAQLVELAKIHVKKSMNKFDESGFSQDEQDDLFNDINKEDSN